MFVVRPSSESSHQKRPHVKGTVEQRIFLKIQQEIPPGPESFPVIFMATVISFELIGYSSSLLDRGPMDGMLRLSKN